MTTPETIAATINAEVETHVGDRGPFISAEDYRNLLRLRFLLALAQKLISEDVDAINLLSNLVTIRTFESPLSGPSADDAEIAAENILNTGQNFYDEFRVE